MKHKPLSPQALDALLLLCMGLGSVLLVLVLSADAWVCVAGCM